MNEIFGVFKYIADSADNNPLEFDAPINHDY